ncbi:D-isomer specific 2-hydroxyacid dehydrogenase family protein [Dolosicoccus paucivorans]|uniref:D-isomer specific 2-hydroxyacid dehydrogenase family protein n=1 Tax=Dolosicoccus paucivorans TaxID=84521 RepID=UPI00088D3957|nr:D-isomer specific 2-hydroxyacid dehydrogenase family protein [Dolosicoccus paucivorans]PMB85078.1 hydroxyacid dehydrogenase [Dolosicoccus paucivorans]SDI68330.1 Lactate dehydrogenase [Dolosicoccus paucivorans]
MKEYKIAVVNSSSFGKKFPRHLAELKEIGELNFFVFDPEISGKVLAQELQGYNIIISSVTPFFTKEFFDNKDELLLISRHGIGYNNIDLKAAEKHNTIVSIVPPLVERDAVAEHNVSNLLNVMRKISESAQEVKEDRWEERAKFVGHTLFNKTVGVIGVGNIGSCVAEIVRLGFRCDVLAYDPYKSKLDLDRFGAKKVDSLEELLPQCDVVCLCASLNAENKYMIGESEVALMKDGVYISNSARGALVDESAIVKGLESEKIAGYACDVLEVEPGRSDHPYLKYKNVSMTPHTGAYTYECLEGMGDKCVADVKNIVDGKLPDCTVQSFSKYIK